MATEASKKEKKSTLFLTSSPEQIHLLHKKLKLLAFHLSGDFSKIKAFQLQLPASSFKAGDLAQQSNIPHISEDGSCAGINGRLIQFLSDCHSWIKFPCHFPSEGGTFENNALVCKFMKVIYIIRPTLPRYKEIWDVSIVFNYLKTLHPPESLSLVDLTMIVDLTMTTVMLIALLSGQRCQTIHALDTAAVSVTDDKCVFYIQELLKTSRPSKHLGKLELQAYFDKQLCVVSLLKEYLERTRSLRTSSRLFISYQKPHNKVSTEHMG
ncbi:predicted protein [Nematostella vectensis]|uniref:Uncharacterized protein n=1 Tax=Nematostella vectensis TaxID=45351 RepID=A7RZ38_NEMVE|nr:predicted protein [Nematostella vectensis]|eukprot:XP_001635352.1 predicted protein [Nematostella vectensis]